MNFFLQGYRYRVLALLVGCCVVNIPGGHTKPIERILSRGKRQTTIEECTSSNQYWDSTTSSCEWCQCPAGQRNTAICGDGIGGKVCQDCPNGTFRGAGANYYTCRPCTICDPDAIVITECTRTEDTRCECREGFGSIREYCVSCQGHPDAEGCPAQHMNTTPALSTSSESPHGGDDSNPVQDKESKCGQKKDMTGWILFGIVSFLCICLVLALCKKNRGICLHRIYRTRYSNQETMTDDLQVEDMSTSGEQPCSNSLGIGIEWETSQNDAHTSAANDATASNGEADALVHQNGEATHPNDPSNSINANNISTSGEQPSSNSLFAGVQGSTVFLPDESSA